MKRKGLVVLALLVVASLMAAMGTGALDVFSAKRSAAMKVVDDTDGLVSIVGDELYAKKLGNGQIKLDFTNTSSGGKGFNTNAKFEFHDVLTITNRSEKTIYVWLESPDWGTPHTHGLVYKIGNTNGGTITKDKTAVPDDHQRLLWTVGTNFKNGKDGKLAYIQLDPGEDFTVDIYVDTEQYWGLNPYAYYSDWDHTVVVKANVEAPIRS